MQRVLCPNPRCQRELQVSMLNEFSECPICHYTFSVSGSRGNFGQSQGVRAGRVESSLDALFSPSASAGVQVGGSVDGLLGSGMLEPSLDHNFFSRKLYVRPDGATSAARGSRSCTSQSPL
eukprot:INCI19000.2.p1 GENE.INCI19000.2~~INCI19000.2.p1  ORF type:complete len:121 (+),score=11.37 INCI19000.2:102-464(+)